MTGGGTCGVRLDECTISWRGRVWTRVLGSSIRLWDTDIDLLSFVMLGGIDIHDP